MMKTLYFRDADGNVSEQQLFPVDARHALRFPHEWAETPDGFKLPEPEPPVRQRRAAPAPAPDPAPPEEPAAPAA